MSHLSSPTLDEVIGGVLEEFYKKEWMKLGEKWQERKTKRMCDAPILGVPLTTFNMRKTSVPHTPYMSNNGHVGPIHPYSSEIINYIFIVSMLVLQKYLYMFTKIFTQSHISAFFSKVASSECRLPGYSLYLKGGSHDGVSKA